MVTCRWHLHYPTVANFVSFLMPMAVCDKDIPSGMRGTTQERELRMEMRDHLDTSLNYLLTGNHALN